jgi:hypothetical protein
MAVEVLWSIYLILFLFNALLYLKFIFEAVFSLNLRSGKRWDLS